MDRKVSNLLCAVAALGLVGSLGGCGGGSSSTGSGVVAVAPAPIPSPTPSPAPTPTPSPTPTPLAGAAALTQVRDFAVLGYSVTGTTPVNGSGPLVQQPGGVAFRYIAAEARHELQIPGRDWGVLGAPFVSGPNFSTQQVTVGSGASAFSYNLNLFLPGDRNGGLPLAYTSYGSWLASAVEQSDPTKVDQNYGSFAYGIATPGGAVPRTGIGQYRGVVFDPYDVTGIAVITIDFATGRVSGTIEPVLGDFGGVIKPGAYQFEGKLTPDSSAFQVGFPIGSTGRTGLLEVQLTGPAAEELMLRWNASLLVPSFSPEPIAYILPGVAGRS